MHRARLLLASLLLALAAASYSLPQPQTSGAQVRAVDNSGRALRILQVGSTLFADARGLEPNQMYEFRVSLGADAAGRADAVGFARVGSDAEGRVPPIPLWYESGIVGCSPRARGAALPPHAFRSFDDADRALRGQTLTLSVHPVGKAPARKSPLEPPAGNAVAVQHLKMTARQTPMLYASDEKGCLLNAQKVGAADLYVSGVGFTPGEELALAVVPDQRVWYVAAPINDVTGDRGEPDMKAVQVGKDGRFTARVWDRARQRRGTFDLVAHRAGSGLAVPRLGAQDIVSYAREVGVILYQPCPPGCLCLDVAGRPVDRSSTFEPAHAFATGEPVYAALNPTFVPDGHPGARYAAFHVVRHRPFDPAAPAPELDDVTGGVEVLPVKAGSISTAEVPVAQAPLPAGPYDLVVTFGDNPGETGAFALDGKYRAAADFVDGGGEAGFVVAEDPYDLGPTPVGRAEYSADDFFRQLGGARDVDLRAVVRYPATAAGDDTPVAPGRHPVFVIEHGNHDSCRDRIPDPQHPGYAMEVAHDACTHRVPNHKGYMHLLDALASHGIIAVSIDAYDLTGDVPMWINERGDLILKHLELWSHLDDPTTYRPYPDFFDGRFRGHVDLSKISVSGHSRGGEASVAAYERNRGVFAINSVSSIAPVDVKHFTLPDVPYFVILPAADGDVADLSGLRIYDRAGTPTGGRGEKSGLYVYGACHNFFNTVWADDGDDSWYPRADYIPKADQQRLGEAYLAAFVRLHLNGETVYRDMLRGRLTFPSTAGFRLYHMHHDANHETLEDGSGREARAEGLVAQAVPPGGVSVHAAGAIRLDWEKAGGRLEYPLPANGNDLTRYRALSFRVAQSNAAPPVRGGLDLEVALREGDKVRATYTGRYAPIPEPYDRHGEFYSVMTTVRIPLSSFIIEEPGLTLKHVDRVELHFPSPSKGEVYVDDIELVR